MNTDCIYFNLVIINIAVIAALYAVSALRPTLSRIFLPIAVGLHLPLVILAFLAEAELRVLFLLFVISAFVLTLSRFIKDKIGREEKK